MALKDIVLKLVIDGKESLVTLDKLDNKTLGLGKTVKNLAGAMGLAFGTAEVIGFMKDSIATTQRYNEVTGMLNATLKSTNYAAGMMSDELIELAGNLEELNNYKIDDKDIIDAEGLLLTFTKINKDIFPKTMQLAIDMSVRFNQDLKSSIIQVGKALQEPEKGLTALRKIGVSFTDQQEELIKSLIKENDLLGAQKIIMGELSTQVSGSAAASVDEYTLKVNRLNDAIEELQKTIGSILTEGAIGFLDLLEGLAQTGSLDGAMVYLKTKQRQSKWKPATQNDYLNEARNTAKNEISGKSDAEIRKMIAHNKAMWKASFEGFDNYGNVIDPEGNMAMLEAKLGVYESALIKSDDKVKEKKKENVYDLVQYQKDMEDIHYKDLLEMNDEFYQAQREALDDLPILDDVTIPKNKTIDELWDDMSGTGRVAITGLMGLSNSFWDQFIIGGRQAKDEWDALWLSFRNSALQELGEIISSNVFEELISSLGGSGSSKNNENSGGDFWGTLLDIGKVVLPFLDEGGIVTRPTIVMAGEKRNEAIIPLDRISGGWGGGSVERKLDQVIDAFERKQFAISMQEFRTVNKRIEDIEKRFSIK